MVIRNHGPRPSPGHDVVDFILNETSGGSLGHDIEITLKEGGGHDGTSTGRRKIPLQELESELCEFVRFRGVAQPADLCTSLSLRNAGISTPGMVVYTQEGGGDSGSGLILESAFDSGVPHESHLREMRIAQDTIEYYEIATVPGVTENSLKSSISGAEVEVVHQDAVSQTQYVKGCVSRELQGEGFHRTLVTTVEATSPGGLAGSCSVRLEETVPETTFVDVYQVAEGVRFGGPEVSPSNPIDLEGPSSSAIQHRISVTGEGKPAGEGKVQLSYPIHLRYQNPARGAGSLSASHLRNGSRLPKPRVSLRCTGWRNSPDADEITVPVTPISHLFPPSSVSSSPWPGSTSSGGDWVPLIDSVSCPTGAADGVVEFSVPVGNLEAFDLVTWTTLLITLFGALYIIFVALRTMAGSRKKKDK